VPNYRIRAATRADASDWLRLVTELARFEKLTPPSPAARRRLVRDAFGSKRRIEVFLATKRDEAVGYAIVAWTYSSFLAKPTLWLEDLYLRPDHRGTGLSRAFLGHLARRAEREGAGRIEGIVLGWNQRAQRFYQRTGATLKKEWILLRYTGPEIRRLARAKTRREP
jgi:GNAT superfamily N-acetyltransferase